MHIATFLSTGELIGIDKAEKGINCQCACYSCKGELIAKQGESNKWHFAHHHNSKTQCEYSFWVVCRDLAKQIFSSKVHPLSTIAISHQIGSKEISRISFEDTKIDDITFDLSFYAKDIGRIFVYFLTPEYNRNQFNSIDTFSENILLINLSKTLGKRDSITEFLYKTIIDGVTEKKFFEKIKIMSSQKIMTNLFEEIELEDNQEKLKQEIINNTPNLSNYKPDIFMAALGEKKFEIDILELSERDKLCIGSLDKIFLSFIQKYGYDSNKNYIYKEISDNKKVFFITYNNIFLSYAILEKKYVLFIPRNKTLEPILATSFMDSIARKIGKFLSKT